MTYPFDNLSPHSKIFIYTAESPWSVDDEKLINEYLDNFIKSWVSHQNSFPCAYKLIDQRFIILGADVISLSGCSIDSSRHTIEELGKKIGKDLDVSGKIWLKDVSGLRLMDIKDIKNSSYLNSDTQYANTLVDVKQELEKGLYTPIHQGWLAKYLNK